MSKDHLFRSMKHGGGNGRKLTHSAKLRFIRIRDWFAAKADFTANEKTLRPESFSLGSSRKNSEAALHADRVGLGRFIECQQSQMKR
jgi:hypothetical protein